MTTPDNAAGLTVPISGIAGDQQASLFGQALPRAGHDQEHLRHRLVRADEHRRHGSRRPSTACSPPWRGSSATTSRTRSRARCSSRARRSSGCATASASSTRRRDAGPLAASVRRHRRSGVRARAHRARCAVLGSVRARHDRRHHARHRARTPRARRDRSDGVADPRRRRRHDCGIGARGRDPCGSTAARA